MDLYYFETPNGRKPCAVARYLNLPVTFRRVDLTRGEQKAAEYRAINPNGRIPALIDGDVKLWESHAIMAYLAQKAGSSLWPSEPLRQVEVLRWLLWDTAHFSRHAGRLFWENYVKRAFGLGEPNEAEVADATRYFLEFAQVLDAHLEGRDHIVDGGLTIADFGVASMLPTAAEGKLPLTEFAQIRRWHDNLLKIPAWREPWPSAKAAA
ncbi:MAG: glutathione S-transferase family protein [Hyphomicrobiaceae bacterium]|nr:glutathione S-transferase family protein [Hyphomicrobiaceae bacterium]MCC0008240.1 glutathione S-transferase family protein [Hyphomicrobiaceae bacterium]